MKTEQLLSLLKIKKVYGTLPESVTDISIDSREAHATSIFVAIEGANLDGLILLMMQ